MADLVFRLWDSLGLRIFIIWILFAGTVATLLDGNPSNDLPILGIAVAALLIEFFWYKPEKARRKAQQPKKNTRK